MPHNKPLSLMASEAAHYALLRRLAPGIRHDLMGVFQPVTMLASMLERRLQASATPDLALVGDNSARIRVLTREAAETAAALVSWLQPLPQHRVGLQVGLDDALSLVSTELSFRGFTLVNQTSAACIDIDLDMQVPQCLLRDVFLAALLALTDAAPSAGEVRFNAHIAHAALVFELAVVPMDDAVFFEDTRAYRALSWDDVQALADAHGVVVAHAAGSVALRWPMAALMPAASSVLSMPSMAAGPLATSATSATFANVSQPDQQV